MLRLLKSAVEMKRSFKMKKEVIKALRTIPGVGPTIARDFYGLGIRKVGDLRGQDPEQLYRRSNKRAGKTQDRCLLYVFRCAVYYASHKKHKPRLLKWWNWKD